MLLGGSGPTLGAVLVMLFSSKSFLSSPTDGVCGRQSLLTLLPSRLLLGISIALLVAIETSLGAKLVARLEACLTDLPSRKLSTRGRTCTLGSRQGGRPGKLLCSPKQK